MHVHRSRRWTITLSLFLWLGMFLTSELALGSGSNDATLPSPRGYVSDYAGVLGSEWKARIRSICKDLERKTGVEMVIVMVENLGPYSTAKQYAAAFYQGWGIGTEQQGHGILVLAVVEGSRSAITVGRRLGTTITHQMLAEIRSQHLEPAFRDGRFGEGLYRLTVALAAAAQEIRVGVQSRPHAKGVGTFLMVATGIGAVAFLWWISRPDLRHPFGRIRRGEFWGSGRGGFRGNFGGFGGGTSGEGFT